MYAARDIRKHARTLSCVSHPSVPTRSARCVLRRSSDVVDMFDRDERVKTEEQLVHPPSAAHVSHTVQFIMYVPSSRPPPSPSSHHAHRPLLVLASPEMSTHNTSATPTPPCAPLFKQNCSVMQNRSGGVTLSDSTICDAWPPNTTTPPVKTHLRTSTTPRPMVPSVMTISPPSTPTQQTYPLQSVQNPLPLTKRSSPWMQSSNNISPVP